MKTKLILLSLTAILMAGCGASRVGPDYRKPPVDTPTVFRGDAPVAQPASLRSLADHTWWEVFRDEQLQHLIRTALEQNYDIRIAARQVLQARAQLGVTRADQLPSLTAWTGASNLRTPGSGPIPAIETSPTELNLNLSWEADFWSKYRRGTEAVRAELLASEWARQAVITTVVADVATAYFQLRELDLELEIAQRTLKSRQDSLQLVKLQEQYGAASMLEIRQAEQLVYTAAGQIPDLERRIEQQENAISILLGENPTAIRRGWKLTEQLPPPDVPAGLPSALLERRPDIREAENRLVAANARIGVAKAAYFPQLTLTATSGLRTAALSNLFSGPAGLWTLVGSLAQPIFSGGRLRSGVMLTEAQQQEALLIYQQTIQQAFREVSDALVARRKNRDFRFEQERLARSAREAARLSDIRYRRGAASYLEVLDSNTRYFEAELGLAQSQLNELLALVELYKALGGGWEQ
ncbi:MAG: efflux transporter outer membrane subunit [Acidobacteria bacterium]|nr:MAG: efflux transporter outer membrane subunit [Acidobacteriota bacterium]